MSGFGFYVESLETVHSKEGGFGSLQGIFEVPGRFEVEFPALEGQVGGSRSMYVFIVV